MPIKPFLTYTPQVADALFIADGAVVIGRVTIGAKSSVWYNVVIRGDVNSIAIGARTNVQDNSVLHVDHGEGGQLTIGNDVTIGHGAIVHACTVADCVLIGMGATVLNGARIERHALIAAGAVVTPNTVVPEATLFGGVPAKKIRMLTTAEIADLKDSAERYVRYALQHIQSS